jgi:vacuole morphology and inheritance protein 14
MIRKYLSDPTPDVRIATENLLGDFLREIRSVSNVRKRRQEAAKEHREGEGKEGENENHDLSSDTVLPPEQTIDANHHDINGYEKEDVHSDINYYDTGGK